MAKQQHFKKEGDYFSYSRLILYSKCRRRYKMEYIDGLKSPATEPMVFGSMCHAALEQIHKTSKRVKDMLSPDEVKAIWEKVFFAGKGVLSQSYHAAGQQALLRYAESLMDFQHIFKAEQKLVAEIAGKKMICVPDRIDIREKDGGQIVRVYEFKSGANIPSKDDLEDDLQMNIEALMASKTFPGARIERCYYSLRKNIPIVDKEPVSEERLEAVEDYVAGLITAMGADTEFLPMVNPSCYDCPAKCEVFKARLAQVMDEAHVKAVCSGEVEGIADGWDGAKGQLTAVTEAEKQFKEAMTVQVLKAGGELVIGAYRYLMVDRDFTVAAKEAERRAFSFLSRTLKDKVMKGKK